MAKTTPVYLVQTDTTVGFASGDAGKLDRIKERPAGKPYLQTLASLRELQACGRVPKAHRKTVRRARRTTFVYPDGVARRLVDSGEYAVLLHRQGPLHSTSANRSGHGFDEEWASRVCDVILFTPAGFAQNAPSSIFTMGKWKVTQLR